MADCTRMEPLLLGPDDGEAISDNEKRSLIIKVEREELTLTWMRYVTGQHGPDPHIHLRHSDCFYVIDGQVTFELGADGHVVRGDPGTFVVVPPNVVHTFRNEGPEPARFLNVHAPSCGFHDHLRAMRDGLDEDEPFDQDEPPPDGGRPVTDAQIAPGGATSDHVSLAEVEIGRADERPAARASRSYWVLDGTLAVRHGDATLEAEAGALVLLPPGAAHVLTGPARIVEVVA